MGNRKSENHDDFQYLQFHEEGGKCQAFAYDITGQLVNDKSKRKFK